MEFTKEYFIEKFIAIPEENWCTEELTDSNNPDCHCALGHCGVKQYELQNAPEEAKALMNILQPVRKNIIKDEFNTDEVNFASVYHLNDYNKELYIGNEELGDTPKERILNALKMA